MSEMAVTPIEKSSPEARDELPATSRPWLEQIWLDTIGRATAKLGLVWIAIITAVAVFAPFIANSFPILAKIDGRWSSPLLHYITPADVTLIAVSAIALALWPFKRMGFRVKCLSIAGSAMIISIVTLIVIHPPKAEVFDRYRTLAKEGRLEKAIYAPIPYSANDRLRDQFKVDDPHPRAPSREHLAGTNPNGADVLSHLIHACRIAMAVGFISTSISMLIGVIIGGLMGYYASWVDLLGMRLVEIFGSMPTMFLLIMFVAAFPDYRSIYLIMAIIGVVSWTGDARFVRAEFLKLRHQDFVQAAIASGLPLRSVLFRHILPNALAPLLVSASFGIAGAILLESTLSFLGLGIPLGEASWGQLLTDAVGSGGSFKWWLAIYPGLAIFLTVLAYNLIGEAIRDALDPKLRKRD